MGVWKCKCWFIYLFSYYTHSCLSVNQLISVPDRPAVGHGVTPEKIRFWTRNLASDVFHKTTFWFKKIQMIFKIYRTPSSMRRQGVRNPFSGSGNFQKIKYHNSHYLIKLWEALKWKASEYLAGMYYNPLFFYAFCSMQSVHFIKFLLETTLSMYGSELVSPSLYY